jgi:hypothetical protein
MISRVLQRFVRGEQSLDNDVLAAIMVRAFLAYLKLAHHPLLPLGIKHCHSHGTQLETRIHV